MCGILIHPAYLKDDNRFKFHLGEKRGIKRKNLSVNEYIFSFDHLPIQTTIDDNPFIEYDGWIILFNGEIFEYPEKFESDVDFIKSIVRSVSNRALVPYELYHSLLKRDGFYAIAMFDSKEENFWFFTDPMGKKPLYFNPVNKIVASELRSCLDYSQDLINFENMEDLFYKGFSNRIPYRNVRRINPGILYVFTKNVLIEMYRSDYNKAYYNLWKGESLRELLQESVDNRIKNLNEITLFYSGGLDSSIINYHIENSVHKPKVERITLDIDEISCSLENTVKIKSDGKSSRNVALMAMELPYDLGSLAYQFDLFKNSNSTVILTGDGADELFGGYSRTTKRDSQVEDIFELIYFHNLKLDKMSSNFTKECRSPFQSPKIISYALHIPYEKRILKKELFEYGKSIGLNCPEKKAMKIEDAEDKWKFRNESLEIWSHLILGGNK